MNKYALIFINLNSIQHVKAHPSVSMSLFHVIGCKAIVRAIPLDGSVIMAEQLVNLILIKVNIFRPCFNIKILKITLLKDSKFRC
jgi:hypothetical protein